MEGDSQRSPSATDLCDAVTAAIEARESLDHYVGRLPKEEAANAIDASQVARLRLRYEAARARAAEMIMASRGS